MADSVLSGNWSISRSIPLQGLLKLEQLFIFDFGDGEYGVFDLVVALLAAMKSLYAWMLAS